MAVICVHLCLSVVNNEIEIIPACFLPAHALSMGREWSVRAVASVVGDCCRRGHSCWNIILMKYCTAKNCYRKDINVLQTALWSLLREPYVKMTFPLLDSNWSCDYYSSDAFTRTLLDGETRWLFNSFSHFFIHMFALIHNMSKSVSLIITYTSLKLLNLTRKHSGKPFRGIHFKKYGQMQD